jgi:hypothetical protein
VRLGQRSDSSLIVRREDCDYDMYAGVEEGEYDTTKVAMGLESRDANKL